MWVLWHTWGSSHSNGREIVALCAGLPQYHNYCCPCQWDNTKAYGLEGLSLQARLSPYLNWASNMHTEFLETSELPFSTVTGITHRLILMLSPPVPLNHIKGSNLH